ncbi:MAG: tRNA threonylcarbamoyladenosine dehydratase [Lachnospiraceae bacterium]|nr:tRNA threonylcarbamoyladenosine dehydratase [Lachnospiraceae bacterium]
MENRFSRTELLLGEDAVKRLATCRVAVFGIGGVGGYVCEALARSGVGTLDLIDSDTVCLSNINRQIIATQKTVGRYKTEVMKERILDINPDAVVNTYNCFFLPENASDFPFDRYDYVVDAIDTVTAKIELVMQCQKLGVPIMSSMGAGNKLDPTRFRVADIYKSSMDPLAKVMRRELKKRGVKKLKVVYSEEEPVVPQGAGSQAGTDASDKDSAGSSRRSIPGSTAFVPSVAGLIIAGEVIKDLIREN